MLDMGVGNPEFLFPYWWKEGEYIEARASAERYMDMEQSSELEFNIRDLHKKVGNIDPDGYEIIIGNGATQLLAAAAWSLKTETYDRDDFEIVTAQAPYFSRFPSIMDQVGIVFSDPHYFNKVIEILTVPNNPNGERKTPKSKKVIVDACYNWPQYQSGDTYKMTGQDIVLFSLSKATGHASTRIGWALVKDPKVAHKMKQFIEIGTMGVSDSSQHLAEVVLWTAGHPYNRESIFEYGTNVLDKRWKQIQEIEHKMPFKILNNQGMFLWCEGDQPVGITCVSGSLCGDTMDKFRLNIGCSDKTFNEFLKRMDDYGSE